MSFPDLRTEVSGACITTYPCTGIDALGTRFSGVTYTTSYWQPLTDPREFDPLFYDHLYDDLSGEEGDLWNHWLLHGQREGRMGSLAFDASTYAARNPDLASAGLNAEQRVDHWLAHGIREGRASSPVLSLTYYLQANADLAQAFQGGDRYVRALSHWMEHGIIEGRRAVPDFDPRWYLAHYSDLNRAYGSAGNRYELALFHWIRHGRSEGRRGVP